MRHRTDDPVRARRPLGDAAGDRDDGVGEHGDPDRDVSEVHADDDHDVHDVHDVHDGQDEGDDPGDGHDVHDVHDVHDIQGDDESDEDADDDDDSDDDSDDDGDEGSDEGSEDDDEIHTDSGEGDDDDEDSDDEDDSDDDSDDEDDSDEGGTDGGGDGSDEDDDSDDEDSDGDDGDEDDDDGDDADGDANYEYARGELDAARSRVADGRRGRASQFGMPDLQVGVIGCGEVAQILHLPHLSSLPDATITAIADLSRERVEHVGERYGVSHRYQRGSTLIEEHRADLDGVVICTAPHTHADLAARALEAGLATFVEPPLAVRPDDASTLCELAEASGVPAAVGYQRRYDPAYHQFAAVLERSGAIRYVDAYDVTPADPRLVRTTYDPVPGSLPGEVAAEADRLRTAQARAALGTDADWIAEAYLYHLGSLCHDVNLLRAVSDDPAAVRHATLDGPQAFLTAELGGEISYHLTSGRTGGEWSEEYLRVDTADSVVRLDCSHPYRRDSPASVTIREGTDEVVTRTHVPTAESPVKRELRSFLDAVRKGSPTETPFADAARDVELIAELVALGTEGVEVSR